MKNNEERLTALLTAHGKDPTAITIDGLALWADEIAEYLSSNAVYAFPCKPGDTLYVISDNRMLECKSKGIDITGDGIQIYADFNCDYNCQGCPFNNWHTDRYTGESQCDGEYGTAVFGTEDFGETVFLSKEEAKRKLKSKK